jgi:hypothetical protein
MDRHERARLAWNRERARELATHHVELTARVAGTLAGARNALERARVLAENPRSVSRRTILPVD